jgi:hypothetical protein
MSDKADKGKKEAKKAVNRYKDLLKQEELNETKRKRDEEKEAKRRAELEHDGPKVMQRAASLVGSVSSSSSARETKSDRVPTATAPGIKDDARLQREWREAQSELKINSRYKVDNKTSFSIAEYLAARVKGRYDI